MDVIEFLQRTDTRNIRYIVGFMIQQRLKENEQKLSEKRERLRNLLSEENLNMEEELSALYNKLAAENEKKRAEWKLQMDLERNKAEEELRKLSNIQRERESCESLRILQSALILAETKAAQLCQIEENQERQKRLQEVEQKWVEAGKRLREEKAKQDHYESLLRKQIAKEIQKKNLKLQEEAKRMQKREYEAFIKEMEQENSKAAYLDKTSREKERLNEKAKKKQQSDLLMDQIRQQKIVYDQQKSLQNQSEKAIINAEVLRIDEELKKKSKEKIVNRAFHSNYLAYAVEEKQKKLQKEKDLEMLFGNKCTLQQQIKTPYGKDKR